MAPPGLSQRYRIRVRVAPGYSGRLSDTALVSDGRLSRELIAPDVTVVGGVYLPRLVR